MTRSQSKCMIESWVPSEVSLLARLTAWGGPSTWNAWCSPKFSRLMAQDHTPWCTATRMLPRDVLQEVFESDLAHGGAARP